MLNEVLSSSAYFGFALTLIAYWVGIQVSKRIKSPICNPLLVALIFIIIFLVVFKIEVSTYQNGAKYMLHFLTPATVCLAVPLYRKFQVLKENLVAVFAGVFAGCISCLVSIFAFSKLVGLDEILYDSLLSKSITTAMAVGVSDEMGALSSVTVVAVCFSGFTGAIIAESMFKLLKIKDPIAQGLSIGTCSHALGTSKAIEIGEIQGAMSGLAIVVAGVLTVILAPIFATFW